jgi:hypothetical protein
MPGSDDTLAATITPETKQNVHKPAILLFYILLKLPQQIYVFFKYLLPQ